MPRPNRIETAALVLLAIFFVGLGVETVMRAAFSVRPMTDAQVFFRAGWAVWAGEPVYRIVDDNGWPYVYPPTLAIAMVPFAAPPAGAAAPWFAMPFPVAVVVLYVIELAACLLAVHLAASAIERIVGDRIGLERTSWGPRWHPFWLLRIGALAAYLPLVSADIGRGQVTTMLLLSFVGFAALLARGRPFAAGLALSVGVTIKVFPAVGLLVPVLRRDWSCLAGFVAGMAVLAVALPLAVFGPERFVAEYRDYIPVVTGMSQTTGGSLGAQSGAVVPDSVGIGAFAYKTWVLISGQPFERTVAPGWPTLLHVAVASLLLAVFVRAFHGRVWTMRGPQPFEPWSLLLAVALLAAYATVAVPVAQLHYMCLAVFLHMLIVGQVWFDRGEPRTPAWLHALAAGVVIASIWNMSESLGRAVLVTAAVYPIAISILLGLVFLRRRTPPRARAM